MHGIALKLVVVSALLLAVGYGSAFLNGGAPAWGVWTFILGTTTMLIALAALGASRAGRSARGLVVPLGAAFLTLTASFAAALLLPATDVETPRLFLGLPLRTAAIVYGVGVLPLLILPVAYAWTFDTLTLTDADWARVREAAEHNRNGRSD